MRDDRYRHHTLASGAVRLAVSGPTARLTLDRAQRLNALTDPMLDDLHDALRRLAADKSIRVVTLTGAGRAFCAGGDLTRRATGEPPPDPVTGAAQLRERARICQLLATMPAITIAAVNGACAGAGLAMAAACDLRIVAQSAVFTSAYLRAGLSGDFGGLPYLARLIGHSAATRWYLLPEKVSATEANRLGLVSLLATDAHFQPTVDEVIGRLTASAPLALRAIKANLSDYTDHQTDVYLAREARRHARLRASADATEAARAFVEKRAPVYRGR